MEPITVTGSCMQFITHLYCARLRCVSYAKLFLFCFLDFSVLFFNLEWWTDGWQYHFRRCASLWLAMKCMPKPNVIWQQSRFVNKGLFSKWWIITPEEKRKADFVHCIFLPRLPNDWLNYRINTTTKILSRWRLLKLFHEYILPSSLFAWLYHVLWGHACSLNPFLAFRHETVILEKSSMLRFYSFLENLMLFLFKFGAHSGRQLVI